MSGQEKDRTRDDGGFIDVPVRVRYADSDRMGIV